MEGPFLKAETEIRALPPLSLNTDLCSLFPGESIEVLTHTNGNVESHQMEVLYFHLTQRVSRRLRRLGPAQGNFPLFPLRPGAFMVQ